MNTIGPMLVLLSMLLNIWTVMTYFLFPYTSWIFMDYKEVHSNNIGIGWHYTLAAIYFILLFMTVWSYLAAKCFEPGFVPRNIRGYEPENLPDRERMLWQYLEKHDTLIKLHDELAQELRNPKIVATTTED